MITALILYNLFALVVTIGGLILFIRNKNERGVERSILLILVQQCLLALGGILFPLDGFGRVQLMAWGVFLYFPLLVLGVILLLRREKPSYVRALAAMLVLFLVIAVDAFVVEPRNLEVTRVSIYSDKLAETVTVALLADIQTDSPGPYEARVLDLVKQADPDLILLAGDYLQVGDKEEYRWYVMVLNEIFRDAELSPPLGMIAVRGNVDGDDWGRVFDGIGVMIVDQTATIDLGAVSVTGIGWLDSQNPGLELPGTEDFHIILGHSPNFSLGKIDGDLLLAGHTHGGQIQLPGLGPVLTLSSVPRSWASGLTEISPDRFLFVSRGIGLEQRNAPRIRFLCRPELVIFELQPGEGKSDRSLLYW